MRCKAGGADVMGIVKSNAYGHGRPQIATALLGMGLSRFGVSEVSEALQLRAELPGDYSLFSWLTAPGATWADAIESGIEVSASSIAVLDDIAASGPAKVHLKIDTGMSRAGALPSDFAQVAEHAAALQAKGKVEIVGIWSHLADADTLDPHSTNAQLSVFAEGIDAATSAGLTPRYHHLAATAGCLWYPQTRFDTVRIGIGLYGMSPNPDRETGPQIGLRPVLRLAAPLVLVKKLQPGQTVSYGGTWSAREPHWVGLVPLGYGDGIPRAASNVGPVDAGGTLTTIVGRVCMDQFVIDLGTGDKPFAEVGDFVTVLGNDGPTAERWAEATGTINYEVTTRLAPYIPRGFTS